MAAKTASEVLTVGGREVAISNPQQGALPGGRATPSSISSRYYLAVADGALRGAGGRPNVLVRYPERHRRRVLLPEARARRRGPPWIEVVALRFPSGRTAEEVVPRDAAALAWMANLGCLELHPHPVRADDLDHPDELRVDLDPVPGVEWPQIREVARVVRATLDDLGLVGWPKTSGSRGMHVYVRIERRWTFDEVRRAALALAREVERRAPALATSKWWKEERHGVFLDYNQNAKDRTVAARVLGAADADARVSAPLTWDEIADVRPGGLHARDHAGALRRRSATGTPAIDATPARSTRCSSCRRGRSARAWATRRGRRTTGSRRASRARRRSAVATSAESAGERIRSIEIGRARSKERRARGARALEGAPPRRRRAPAAGRRAGRRDARPLQTWTRIRVNLQHVPEALRPPQEPLDPDETWRTTGPASAGASRPAPNTFASS